MPNSDSTAERLKQSRDEIIRDWEERVRLELPAARKQTKLALIDALPRTLDQLAEVLAMDPTSRRRDASLFSSFAEHGVQRADLPSYTLDEALLEYQVLRQVLLESLERSGQLQADEREVILDYLQHGMSVAAQEFLSVLIYRERIATERAERAVKTLADLQIVTEAALAKSGNLHESLYGLLGLVRMIFDSDMVAILLMDEDRKTLSVRATQGLEEDVRNRVKVPIGRGIGGKIAEMRKTLVFEDLSKTDVFSPHLKEIGLQYLIGTPLKLDHELIGVVYLGRRAKAPFTVEDVRLFELISDRIALAIDRSILFERSKESIAKLQAERGLRGRLASLLTHDIRNPITAALLSAQMLFRREKDPVNRELAMRIVHNLRRSDSLIKDLLDVNRILSGRSLELETEELDLSEFIQSELSGLEKGYGKRIVFQGETRLQGNWSRTEVRRIIDNLVKNSVQDIPPDAPIRIRLERTSRGARLRCDITGQKLTAEEEEALKRSYPDRSEAEIKDGRVLRLTLIRGLAEAHQGSVRAETLKEGRGVVFVVDLPQASQSIAKNAA